MRADRVKTAFLLTLRQSLRGRLVLALVVLVPTLFYLFAALTAGDMRIPLELAALRSGRVVEVPQRHGMAVFIALAAVGLLTSFVGMRLVQDDLAVNRRLVLCGFHAHEILSSKLLVLLAVTAVLVLVVGLPLPLFFFGPQRLLATLAGLVAGAWVYGCFGLMVGALVRRELPGILCVALLTNLDSGWLQNPALYAQAQNRALIRWLPAHWPSQASMLGAFTDEPVGRALAGSLVYGLAFLLLAVAAFAWHTRRHGA